MTWQEATGIVIIFILIAYGLYQIINVGNRDDYDDYF